MTGPTVGALFAGYGGLERGIAAAIPGARTAWVSEIDPAAALVLETRFGVPNLGDITEIRWGTVPRVNILAGGFPCQDLSEAGLRAGMDSETRSGLWAHFAVAIGALRPDLVVIENVRGMLSARADRPMEPCPWCMGDPRDGKPLMRALGAVLADLADLGYDAAWCGLRASDVAAPHHRFRVFIVARPRPADPDSLGRRPDVAGLPAWEPHAHGGAAAHADGVGRAGGTERARPPAHPEPADHGHAAADAGRTGHEGVRSAEPGRRTDLDGRITADPDGIEPERRGIARVVGGASTTEPSETPERERAGNASRDRRTAGSTRLIQGPYGPAVRQWESVLGRPAPDPVELSSDYVRMLQRRLQRRDPRPAGRRGSLAPRWTLSPRFAEWMMGLPDGWVTDVPGISRREQLRILGNGVVEQQAAAAVRYLLDVA